MKKATRERELLQEQLSPKDPKNHSNIQAGQVRIDYYTDPLCCWSWAFEASWHKLLEEHGQRIDYRYVLCGMIPDWKTYNDPLNSVSNPMQMGPVWMHASQITHTKMKYSIWHEDPPASSYPACIAVKTADLQSSEAGHEYLFQIRKTLMEEGKNISKTSVLLEVAEKMDPLLLDFSQFKLDLEKGRGLEGFRTDLQKSKFHNIGRYPTLTFQNEMGKGIMIVGYRPYDVLLKAFEHVM